MPPRRSIGRDLWALLSAVTLAAATACASAPDGRAPAPLLSGPVYPGEDWERIPTPEAAGFAGGRLDSLRSYVESLNTTGLLAVHAGRVLFEYGDVTQLSYVASVRKSILAMLFGNYVQDGTIQLTKTLGDLEMTDHGGLLQVEERATIEHLITARSGVYHPASNGGDNSANAPPRGSQPPGSYFLYNNWDFNAAGAAFERETGIDIYDALHADLAVPIGMQDFERTMQRKRGNLERSLYPAYHMWLSTRDMARIGYLMLRKGRWEGRQVVPPDWVERIVRVVTPLDEMNPDWYRRGPLGYGYMWWIWDGPSAAGPFDGAFTAIGAYGQYITVLPALDLVVAHKTAVPPERRVTRSQYLELLDRLVAARCDWRCP